MQQQRQLTLSSVFRCNSSWRRAMCTDAITTRADSEKCVQMQQQQELTLRDVYRCSSNKSWRWGMCIDAAATRADAEQRAQKEQQEKLTSSRVGSVTAPRSDAVCWAEDWRAGVLESPWWRSPCAPACQLPQLQRCSSPSSMPPSSSQSVACRCATAADWLTTRSVPATGNHDL